VILRNCSQRKEEYHSQKGSKQIKKKAPMG
jgi:hypothetical protein